MMGFIFCSMAFWFEASCHSFVMVFGGGGAKIEQNIYPPEYPCPKARRTHRTRSGEQQPAYPNHDGHTSNNLEHLSRRASWCARAMRTKSDVVCYPCQRKDAEEHDVSEMNEETPMRKWRM